MAKLEKEIWLADDMETWLIDPDDILTDTDRARLAGCAPELLAACKAAADFKVNGKRTWLEISKMLFAAIHKAEGK